MALIKTKQNEWFGCPITYHRIEAITKWEPALKILQVDIGSYYDGTVKTKPATHPLHRENFSITDKGFVFEGKEAPTYVQIYTELIKLPEWADSTSDEEQATDDKSIK